MPMVNGKTIGLPIALVVPIVLGLGAFFNVKGAVASNAKEIGEVVDAVEKLAKAQTSDHERIVITGQKVSLY